MKEAAERGIGGEGSELGNENPMSDMGIAWESYDGDP